MKFWHNIKNTFKILTNDFPPRELTRTRQLTSIYKFTRVSKRDLFIYFCQKALDQSFEIFFKILGEKMLYREFPDRPVVWTLTYCGAQIQSLVEELRSHKPLSMVQK